MPDARTWLPYVAPADQRRIRTLVAEAVELRRAGQLEAGLRLEAQARLAAAQFLARDPPAARMTSAMVAVREWEARAADRLRAGQYPALDSTAGGGGRRPRGRRGRAGPRRRPRRRRPAGRRGRDGARVAPVRVALRLVERAEQRIDADAAPAPDLRRARMLLRTAREAMATGDEMRAMKRAWYAQQIVDAHDAGVPDSLR